MEPSITIPRNLALHLVKHLSDIMTTDEAHIIFDTTDTHEAVKEHTAQLFAHIIEQTL